MLVPGGPLIQGVSVMSGVLILIILGNNNNYIAFYQTRAEGWGGLREGAAGPLIQRVSVMSGVPMLIILGKYYN